MSGQVRFALRTVVVVLLSCSLPSLGACGKRTDAPPVTEAYAAATAAAPAADVASAVQAPEPRSATDVPAAAVAEAGVPAEAVPSAQGAAGPADPESLATCDDVGSAYSRLVANQSCTVDADCHVVGGSCAVGLGGCHETVNVAVTQQQLGALTDRWTALGCIAGACRCAPEGPVKCQDGTCVEVGEP
jgi:hypothetical protein